MKKLLTLALLGGALCSVLAADWDIYGKIVAVDDKNKTVTLEGTGGVAVVQILPYTELKGDNCGQWGNDVYGTFVDLSVGKIVEMEVYPVGMVPPQGQQAAPMQGVAKEAQFIAKEVEWKCLPPVQSTPRQP